MPNDNSGRDTLRFVIGSTGFEADEELLHRWYDNYIRPTFVTAHPERHISCNTQIARTRGERRPGRGSSVTITVSLVITANVALREMRRVMADVLTMQYPNGVSVNQAAGAATMRFNAIDYIELTLGPEFQMLSEGAAA